MAWPLTGRESEVGRIRAALDDPVRRPLAVVGRPGVGTSRLLGSAAEHGRMRGWHVHAVAASPALRDVPFGAVAPFASEAVDIERGDRLRMIAAIERDLLASADGAELMVVIDGAQWLDVASVALLERLRDHRRARIAVSVRNMPQPGPDAWSLATTHTEIVEVAPLSREAHDRLVGAVRDRPLTREAGQALWDHTGGRPRDLELLLDAIDRGDVIDPEAAVWHWVGGPADSPGLRSLVAEHLSGVGEAARRDFELVALGAPLPLEVADGVLDDAAREELERAELVDVSGPAEAAALRPTRALVARWIVGRMGPTARRRLQAKLAAVAPPTGASWTLRHARWAIESGVPVAGDLGPMARAAMGEADLWLAEQLARSAMEEEVGDVEVHVVLAETLRRGRRADEALQVLDEAARHVRTDEQRTEISIVQAQVDTLLNRDPQTALRRLDAALDVVADADARRRLARERDLARAFVDPVGTAPAPEHGPERALTDGETQELMVVALLRCLHLDLGGIDGVLRELRDAVSDRGAEPLMHARVAVCEHLALVGRGRVGDAHSAARAALDAAAARGEPLGMWALCVAFSGPLTGDLDAAAVAAFDADRSFRAVDPFGLRPLSAAIGATAAWQAGRPEMAATLAAIAERSDNTDQPVAEIATHRRRAWEAVVAGDPGGGAEAAAVSGRLAMEAGHRLWGVVGLHESVRLGAADLVAEDLHAIAAVTESALVRSFAAHAEALAARAAEDLDAVAVDLAGLGCPLLAAEAAAQAARHSTDDVASTRSAARAEAWWSRCTGRVPPALVGAPPGLTARQHEIAGLAALGLSSQEIADRLVVSRRTVDNHLRSVYRRLDVSGRDELAIVLRPAIG
ncbi:MAG: LuxR C-terminal-related transcriptional regulator [Acidimicrobiales bacterium]